MKNRKIAPSCSDKIGPSEVHAPEEQKVKLSKGKCLESWDKCLESQDKNLESLDKCLES